MSGSVRDQPIADELPVRLDEPDLLGFKAAVGVACEFLPQMAILHSDHAAPAGDVALASRIYAATVTLFPQQFEYLFRLTEGRGCWPSDALCDDFILNGASPTSNKDADGVFFNPRQGQFPTSTFQWAPPTNPTVTLMTPTCLETAALP